MTEARADVAQFLMVPPEDLLAAAKRLRINANKIRREVAAAAKAKKQPAKHK